MFLRFLNKLVLVVAIFYDGELLAQQSNVCVINASTGKMECVTGTRDIPGKEYCVVAVGSSSSFKEEKFNVVVEDPKIHYEILPKKVDITSRVKGTELYNLNSSGYGIAGKYIIIDGNSSLRLTEGDSKMINEKIKVVSSYSDWKKGRYPIAVLSGSSLSGSGIKQASKLNKNNILCKVSIPDQYRTISKIEHKEWGISVYSSSSHDGKDKRFAAARIIEKPGKTASIYIKSEESPGYISYDYKKCSASINDGNSIIFGPLAKQEASKIARNSTVYIQTEIGKCYAPSVSIGIGGVENPENAIVNWVEVIDSVNASPEVIRRIQVALKDRGFYTGSVDGVLGAETLMAISKYGSN